MGPSIKPIWDGEMFLFISKRKKNCIVLRPLEFTEGHPISPATAAHLILRQGYTHQKDLRYRLAIIMDEVQKNIRDLFPDVDHRRLIVQYRQGDLGLQVLQEPDTDLFTVVFGDPKNGNIPLWEAWRLANNPNCIMRHYGTYQVLRYLVMSYSASYANEQTRS